MATTQDALQITTITPSLTVDDVKASLAFYEALGFTVDQRWEENGQLLGVMLRAGSTQIGISQDDWKKGRDRKKGVGLRLYFATTQNVDEVAARAKRAGLTLDSEPHEGEENMRLFEITDPNGFLLSIVNEPSR